MINSLSKDAYGHLRRKKRQLMGRIEGINRCMSIDGENHALRSLLEVFGQIWKMFYFKRI